MNELEKAEREAHARVRTLEMNLRAEIVNAVGSGLEGDVRIMRNGGLWIHGANQKRRAQIIESLAKANVSLFGKWTPLPDESIEAWEKAGRALK